MNIEAINKMMKKITLKSKMPKHWNEFIESTVKKHNFIIKDTANRTFHCTNCQHNYYNSKLKIGDITECPNCHNEYYIYSIKSRSLNYTDNVILVKKIKKQIVIRVFEIWTFYNRGKNILDYSVQEYARHLPGIGTFINDHVEFYYTGMQIYHFDMEEYWRPYKGERKFTEFPTYPFNKKRIIKGTKLEYAPIDECLKKFKELNFLDVLMIAANDSFELLWKMKLYNLSIEPWHFNKKGSFYKRFGVSKNCLEFMQTNNISYRQLMFFRLLKTDDMDILRKIENWSSKQVKFLLGKDIFYNYINHNLILDEYKIDTLKKIEKYTPLKKLNNYTVAFENLNIYKDYLEACEKLGIKLISRKTLFPDNLIKSHDEVINKLDSIENGKANLKIWPIYLKLSKYTYNDDEYIIYPSPSAESMKDESKQQGNCVGYSYLEPYSDDRTEIYFIRKLKNPIKSFITLEYKNGKVVQKELPFHCKNFTKEQNDFIEKWIGYRSFIDNKEKFKNKNKIDIKKYNIKNMVA